MSEGAAALRHSLLDAEHRALGARMVPFGGWEMPIQYTGVLEEHRACREHAVVFDVSHLGSVHVQGAGAFAALQWAFTNDLDRISPGRAQYTHLLDPARRARRRRHHRVVGRADGVPGDAECVEHAAIARRPRRGRRVPRGWGVRDRRRHRDARGPRGAGARSPGVVGGDRARGRAASRGSRSRRSAFGDEQGWIAGTGYTGEDGVELHVPGPAASQCWQLLLDAGITPAGLGARDTLRLEAGLPLHGHELGPGITPLQAGLAWVVRFDKGDFRGRAALEAERDRGVARRLRGLSVDGRQIPREGYAVSRGGVEVGVVTSGNFSPTLGHAIALAFLPPETVDGEVVSIDVRGRAVPAIVTKLPFVRR